mgnify:CR=1 FL=1
MQLETERLILRQFMPADAEAYHAAVYGDPDVMTTIPRGSVPPSIERTRQTIDTFLEGWKRQAFGGWAVFHKGDQRLIGHCGLQYISVASPPTDEIEVFYAIAKPYWGQGLTTEAARATVAYGFGTCQLDQIAALAVPENTASRRVMEKLGMTYQGITNRFYDTDLAYYLLRREDYQQQQEAPPQ